MAEPPSPWKQDDIADLASSSVSWFEPPNADAVRSGSPPGARAASVLPPMMGSIMETDGMQPLRNSILDIQTPFKCALDRGSVHVCSEFRQGFQGRGAERYETGEIYVGDYMAGERFGKGTFRHANGQTLVSSWKDNRPVGEGVQWSRDHKKAARLKNGIPVGSLSLEDAAEICGRIGLPVPADWMLR